MTRIMIAGVGGQGTLLTSKVLGRLALLLGRDVKVSEVHGMAQRGGSVVTHVKFGDKVHSSLVEPGEADVVLAFELLEAYRYRAFLKPGGLLALNTQRISPMPVVMGAEYPQNLLEALGGLRIRAVDALALAREAGSEKSVNMVMIGLLAAELDIADEIWREAIATTVPPKTVDVNLKAYALGRG